MNTNILFFPLERNSVLDGVRAFFFFGGGHLDPEIKGGGGGLRASVSDLKIRRGPGPPVPSPGSALVFAETRSRYIYCTRYDFVITRKLFSFVILISPCVLNFARIRLRGVLISRFANLPGDEVGPIKSFVLSLLPAFNPLADFFFLCFF